MPAPSLTSTEASSRSFRPECRAADYEQRITAAYPIHPEVFDRLYTDWSTLVTIQRTRGVLRLMAAVIHSLWEKGDRSPLTLPANLSIDEFVGGPTGVLSPGILDANLATKQHVNHDRGSDRPEPELREQGDELIQLLFPLLKCTP